MAISKAAYEGDVVSRLRNWRGLHLAHSGDLCEEAADEIETLRTALARIASQDATFSVIGGNIIVDVDAKLTDAEREALTVASIELQCLTMSETNHSAALRGLLARLG